MENQTYHWGVFAAGMDKDADDPISRHRTAGQAQRSADRRSKKSGVYHFAERLR